MNKLIINQGKIFIHRAFDVADNINTLNIENFLNLSGEENKRVKLKKDSMNTVVLKEEPLVLKLQDDKISGKNVSVFAKIWDYGVISILYEVDIENMPWKDFLNLACEYDDSLDINEKSLKSVEFLVDKFSVNIERKNISKITEDFSTYLIKEITDSSKNIKIEDPLVLIREYSGFAELIIGENEMKISERTKNKILNRYSQYSDQDLILVDWNSALIIDFTDSSVYLDYLDILDFSLSHLLELRVYDDLLDEKIKKIYWEIRKKKTGGLKSFASLSEDASLIYLEFSEFIERIDNSLKTVGDSFLAAFFRDTSEQMRFLDWKNSLSEKLKSLAKISEILQGESNSKKSHLLEIIIILLIAVEVVPYLYNSLIKLF